MSTSKNDVYMINRTINKIGLDKINTKSRINPVYAYKQTIPFTTIKSISQSREINDHFTKSSTEQVFRTDLFVHVCSRFNPMTGAFTAHVLTSTRTMVLRTNPHRTRTCRKVTKTSGKLRYGGSTTASYDIFA